MKRSVQIILFAFLAFAMPAKAASLYSCDFETEQMRSRWVLTPASASTLSILNNKWYLGAQGNNSRTGSYGLYVSDNNGASAHYTNSNCFIFAYDTITLDPSTGDYLLTFDYCAMGNGASKFDGIYAFWIPMNDPDDGSPIVINSSPNAQISNKYANYLLKLQPQANMNYLCGTMTWHQCAVKIKGSLCDGTPHYLAFAWGNKTFTPQQPGAMIDNILITDGEPCPQPTNLVVTPNGSTVSLEWQGTATEYEVSAYSYDGETWLGPKVVQGNQTNFTGLPIGQADFIVRAKCGEGFYSLKTIVSQLIYYPDQLCVDYLNLDSAVCYTATTTSQSDLTDFDSFTKVNHPVDLGPTSSESRHTLHFDRAEYDPRTNNMAKTVPDGELASVRLGNWESGNGAERIEFTFDVDTIKYPVLILKYLPILEAPGHGPKEDPRFKLDLLVGNTTIGRCGQADFNCNDVYDGQHLLPGAAEQGWHVTPAQDGYQPIVWKDWTTVGVNLKQYVGSNKKITARLTTFDCTWGGHCGYAYFTLGCSDGKLKGMKCGEINPVFSAPDGFLYRWAYASSEKYRDKRTGAIPEQYVLGRAQEYNAGMQDDNLYVVDCMFVQDTTCYFSLYASTLATNPISVMNKPKIYMNCRDSIYRVTFDASPSWVQEIDHVTGDTLVSKAYHIETYEWNIEGLPYGWSDEIKPTFDFPLDGGDFEVTLRTTCGTCDSVLHYHLHLDPLGATKDMQTFTLCDADRKGEGFHWAERTDTVYRTYGIVDSVNLLNPLTTCDSIIYLELIEPVRIFEDTMLLPESLPFTYHGKTYDENTKSLIDTVPDPDDCSKTWVLNLEIYESLIASMISTDYFLCEGDPTLSLVYDIKRGRSLRYTYTFDNPAIPSLGPVNEQQKKGQYQIDIPIAPSVEPNIYTGSLFLADSMPEFSVTIPFSVSLRYSSRIITQRWNDVLAICNEQAIKDSLGDHGYPYQFTAVQWYLNGQPINEANSFNYFAGEGSQLLFGEPYQALLTRPDGVQLFTCEFQPSKVDDAITDLPSLVNPNASMRIKGRGTAFWYDMLGRRHMTQTYDDSDITAPGTKGYYLLILQPEEAEGGETEEPSGSRRVVRPVMVH